MAEGLIGLIFAGMVLLTGFGLWRLIRWLLRWGEGPVESPQSHSGMVEFLMRLWAWLQYRWRAIRLYMSGPEHIGHLFAALQAWGRSSGVGRLQHETLLSMGKSRSTEAVSPIAPLPGGG